MWYPLALYTTFNADILPASLAWAASALFGITPIVFAVPVVFTIAVSQENLLIGITLGPAILTVTGRLLPLFQTGAIRGIKASEAFQAKCIAETLITSSPMPCRLFYL